MTGSPGGRRRPHGHRALGARAGVGTDERRRAQRLVSPDGNALSAAVARPRWREPIAWLEAAALAGFAWLWCGCAARLAHGAGPLDWLLVAAGLCAGHALADLVTGTSHWLCDRVLDPKLPVVGPLIVQAFRDHHVDPLGITRHDALGVNGNAALVSLPVLAAAVALPGPASPAARLAWAVFVGLVTSAVATNQLHAWAHAKRVPRGVAWLQRRGAILSPEHHALHHTGSFDRAYGVTTGWWNPLLDRARVFHRAERWLAGHRSRSRAAARG